jgi:hypothetical protein
MRHSLEYRMKCKSNRPFSFLDDLIRAQPREDSGLSQARTNRKLLSKPSYANIVVKDGKVVANLTLSSRGAKGFWNDDDDDNREVLLSLSLTSSLSF